MYGRLRNPGSQDQILSVLDITHNTFISPLECWNFLHKFHPAMGPCSWLCHRAAPDTDNLLRTQGRGARCLAPQWETLLTSLHVTAPVRIWESNFSGAARRSDRTSSLFSQMRRSEESTGTQSSEEQTGALRCWRCRKCIASSGCFMSPLETQSVEVSFADFKSVRWWKRRHTYMYVHLLCHTQTHDKHL